MGRENGHSVVAGVAKEAGMDAARSEPHSPEVKPQNKSSEALSQVQVGEGEKQRTPHQARRVSEPPSQGTKEKASEKKFFRECG